MIFNIPLIVSLVFFICGKEASGALCRYQEESIINNNGIICVNNTMHDFNEFLDSFENPVPMRYLYFQNCSFGIVDNSTFSHKFIEHMLIKEVFITNSSIDAVNDHSFIYFKELQSLTMQYSNISRIESKAFDGLSVLYKFNFQFNRLTNTDRAMFLYINNLRELNLAGNNITSVDAYNVSSGLQYLNLSMNPIKEINKNSIGELNIILLDLSHCQLTILEKRIFKNLNNLQILNISYNKITDIELGAFEGIERIEVLDLNHNRVRRFTYGTFSMLSLMTHLDVSYNWIYELLVDALFPLNQLQHLYLQGNRLKTMDIKLLLKYLKYLKKTDLYENLWECDELALICYELQIRGIVYLAEKTGKFDVTNINGITCNNEIYSF